MTALYIIMYIFGAMATFLALTTGNVPFVILSACVAPAGHFVAHLATKRKL